MKKPITAVTLSLGLAFSAYASASAADISTVTVNKDVSTVSISWNSETGTPYFVTGTLATSTSMTAEELVLDYLSSKKNLFKFSSPHAKQSFKILEVNQDDLGFTHLRLQQMHQGIPVYGSQLTAHVKNGTLMSVSGTVIPDLEKKSSLKKNSKLTAQEAIKVAEEKLGFTADYEKKPHAEYMVYTKDGQASLAYVVNLNFLYPEPGNWMFTVDAVSGDVLNSFNAMHYAKGGKGGKPGGGSGGTEIKTTGTGTGVLGDAKTLNITQKGSSYYLEDRTRDGWIYTYDASNRTRLPGKLWEDLDAQFNLSYDAAAVDAHYYAGVTYDYFMTKFNRNSYDGNGAALHSTVHYSRSYNNAFWNGQQMVYGDGDGTTFVPLSGALDVVAHELTHAVTDSSADLIYQNESGAINESMSDIFGTLTEFHANNNPDWLVGEDIYTPGIEGDALRSMADPTASNDPDHYSVRYTGTQDNGGVHWNSGIINKAAYLLSQGGTHYGVAVTGIGNDKMGAIFYRSLTQYLTASSNFSHLRAAAVQSATDLYGANSSEVASVNQAFDAVGVN
ncbi:bacillolysin [Lottiidibacillus patelloidae]|uniref:Neutral metalloproteinase n=1 Tax=Lottiidibacillus patelloidae TaxID=2670334 RepID=A0A263BU09_9BACI|nr:M4 family metallopeptidase [Lottiidibacillus patelloidae]OZM57048.1 bacillolysin [Lottiidibacillus patelloidae]